MLIALIVGGWWGYHYAKERYFLSTDDSEAIVLERGLNYTVLGRDLHEEYQHACLSEDASVRLTDPQGASGEDCHRFSLKDLPASARSSIQAMPAGTYEEINQQLRRLADQALPACVTVHKEAHPEQIEEKSRTGELAKPGVDCREVK